MIMGITTLVYVLAVVASLLYFFSKWKFSYWKNRNVFHFEPTFFYGNMKQVLKRKMHMTELISQLYYETKARGKKYCGIYSFWNPQFIPVDLELIKCVMQTDFAHFSGHGMYLDEDTDPLTGHLFNLEDEKWRNLRAKLTPTFTSGKMKMMFQTIMNCTNGLQWKLKESAAINEPLEIKETLARFTTDIIGSVAFGLEIDTIKNPDNEFRQNGKKIFQHSLSRRIHFMLLSILPTWLFKSLGFKLFSKDMESFFINLVKNTVEYREKNKVFRKDFMHLLIQLKNLGKVTDDAEGLVAQNNVHTGLTINQMAAQTFVFFLAGFETSATTLTYALFELAQNKDIQKILRQEISEVLKRHDNKLTYEAIMEMNYLDKVLSETLRKYSPASILPRVCNKEYKVPNSELIIKPGTRLIIPVHAIHRDPEYYPEPEKFDPERFNEENKASRPGFCYMPFGEGPRTCIGLRFGKLEAKVGLCSVLMNYSVTVNEKTKLPFTFTPDFFLTVQGGVWLNMEPLKENN